MRYVSQAMTDYLTDGLVKRRAALAGEMLRTQEALAQMARDLETLDNAIKLPLGHGQPVRRSGFGFRPAGSRDCVRRRKCPTRVC